MSKPASTENQKRAPQPMPDFVRDAIRQCRLVEKYEGRPAYQRNDYLIWINDAKREETKQKRLERMLDELGRGGVYMGMKWNE